MAESAVQKANLNDFSEVKSCLSFLTYLLTIGIIVNETAVTFTLNLYYTLTNIVLYNTNYY